MNTLQTKRIILLLKPNRGEMKSEPTDPNLKLILYNGNRYEELKKKCKRKDYVSPHAKVSFDEYEMNIDLSQFNKVDLDEENITTSFRMQKIDQLRISIDTLDQTNLKKNKKYFIIIFLKNWNSNFFLEKKKDIIQQDYEGKLPKHILNFINTDENWKKATVFDQAISN